MTTARDLVLVTLGMPADQLVGQGDLSLALAGAEAIDLLHSGALRLDGDRIVPGPRMASGDPLLDQADAALVRREPYETVEEWLWRRAEDLVPAYAEALELAGLVAHPHGHGLRLVSGRAELADSPARREAEQRRASGEPVLAGLLVASGLVEPQLTDAPGDDVSGTEEAPSPVEPRLIDGRDDEGSGAEEALPSDPDDGRLDDAVTTVLIAVGDAVVQLEALRLRRDVENAAFDNVWRGW
ncbi:GPP34 family phosphoprotein [Streptomyces sp. Act143]|uniref:GOLPH3/VPS74 family protein n=1 Tax=Streptomyces sp. Act143 TaxID=2200760 RepID=UPI000D674C4C|nr:GPP34 family phosphoprotein [Streptomyces sp. Act143]PWI15289.1 GPP34 family phosphoprotein [Streptomyces sp. Act143]